MSVQLIDTAGDYIKTACMVSTNVDRATADSYCKTKHMALFVINSIDTQNALFTELETAVPISYRIDGVQSADENWYYNGNVPAYSGLAWRSSSKAYLDWNTLVATNIVLDLQPYKSTFAVDGAPASDKLPFVCEYMQ